MKHLFIAIIAFSILSLHTNAQPGLNVAQRHRAYVDSLLATVGINQQTIATGILYDRAPTIAKLQGFQQSDVVGKGRFLQAAHELRNSTYDSLIHPTIDRIKEISEHYTYSLNLAPIGISYSTMTHIDTLAVEKGYIIIDGQGRPRPTGRLKTHGLIDRDIFMASVLWDKDELNVTTDFVIPSQLIMGNKKTEIAQVEVDFGDGLGFRSVTPDVPVSIAYQTDGEKVITIRATDELGNTLSSIASLKTMSGEPFEWGDYGYIDEVTYRRIPIYADIPFTGAPPLYSPSGTFPGLGWVTYLLNDPQQGLQKPVLVVDGFDPEGKRTDEKLFETHLNPSGFKFADSLHAAGYDLVILDFPKAANDSTTCFYCTSWNFLTGECHDWHTAPCVINGGSDYIQRNAFVTIKVIEEINQQLQSNNSQEQLVVIGPSMGGLITRYALAYMEQSGKQHNTRLWVSFDAPHKGANIPIGLQHAVNELSFISAANTKKNTLLNNPAAKQMLIHHYLSNSVLPAGAPSFRDSWQAELESIGFPQSPNLRRISIVNGSLNGFFTGLSGVSALSVIDGNNYLHVLTTPSYGSVSKVFDANINLLGFNLYEVNKYAKAFPSSFSIDNSPGGTQNTFEGIKHAVESATSMDVQMFLSSHSFIPTKSALAYMGTNTDLKESLYNRNLVSSNQTPFHSYWGPVNKNMPHVEFDANVVCWILNEINGNPMPPSFDFQITGPSPVCSSNSTFTINGLPAGISVTWSHASSLFTYVSGQGTNSYVVKARSANVNGSGWVQATINGPCGPIQLSPKTVWVGTPPPGQILGPYYNHGMSSVCKGLSHNMELSPTLLTLQYEWKLIYPDGFSWPLESTSRTASFCVDATGLYTAWVRQKMEGCSWSQVATKSFNVENCGNSGTCSGGGIVPRLLIAPNPASIEITISEIEPANDNIPWVLRLMSGQGAVMVNVTTVLPQTLSVQGLQPGVYVLHARRGSYSEQQVVVIE